MVRGEEIRLSLKSYMAVLNKVPHCVESSRPRPMLAEARHLPHQTLQEKFLVTTPKKERDNETLEIKRF